MSTRTHRRAVPANGPTWQAAPEKASPAERGVENSVAAQEVEPRAAAGPFGSPFLNAALAECFGSSLSGITAKQDAMGNEAIGARASTRGTDISLGGNISQDPSDLDSMETLAHETAHAMAGGGSAKTELDQPGDRGEKGAVEAGQAFRAWAASGFAGPAPRLKPAVGGEAAIHRDHVAPGAVTGRPILRLGSNGRQVRALQQVLNAKGFRVGVDGAFGPRTQAAVLNFQRSVGITADGRVGPQTAERLNRHATVAPTPRPEQAVAGGATVTGSPMLSFGARGGIVSALQRLLIGKGAEMGVDAVFGAQTHQAVRAFQAANGLGVDGVVGPSTARKLNDPASARIPAGARGSASNFDPSQHANMRDAVIAAAEGHMGKRYYWGADGPGTFDCSGFVLWVLRQDTGLVKWGDDTAAGIANRLPRTTSPKKGDMVFYRGSGGISHVEIAMGQGSRTLGASGGGSRTFGDNPNAKVQYGDWSRDGRTKSFGSIQDLITQRLARQGR